MSAKRICRWLLAAFIRALLLGIMIGAAFWYAVPEGFILFTPHDWATANRTPGFLVGFCVGLVLVTLLSTLHWVWQGGRYLLLATLKVKGRPHSR